MEKEFKIVTLRDIANEAGLSTTAVSKALNNKGGVSRETEMRVKDIAKRLGYRANFIAKSLKVNSTKTLGFVISDSSQSFFASIIKGVEEEASKRGYNIILANTNKSRDTEKKAINILIQRRVEGLLLAATTLTKVEDIDYLDTLGVPYVFLVRRSEKIDAPFVGNDNILGACCIVDYLIKTGSKKIHFLNMAKDSITTSSKDRLQGYINALEFNGLKYDPGLVYYMNAKIEEGYTVMRNILESGEKVSCLFCGCDILSIGAMEAILEKGLDIPKDIRVCGYDDIEFAAYLRKPLTTMRQPKEIIGTKGVEMLLNRLNKINNQPRVIVLKSELVVRQST